MQSFIAIQNTYTHLQIALFVKSKLIASCELDKTVASKECIPALQKLLADNHLTLSDLSFIAANQGPGPFTTLRVVIATVNGLSFAQKIPLIGVNALEALLAEHTDQQPNKIALLNAFGHDLYYGIHTNGNFDSTGCGAAESVLLEIAQKCPQNSLLFLGNGIEKCEAAIKSTFAHRAVFLTPNPQTASINQIGLMALQQWEAQKNLSYELQPLYYKQAFIP